MASSFGVSSKPLIPAQCLVTMRRYTEAKKQYDLKIEQFDQTRLKYKNSDQTVDKMYAECRHLIGSRYIAPETWRSWSRARQAEYRAETVRMTETLLGSTTEALREKLYKEAGLSYPMPSAIALASLPHPPHYNIALLYERIMEQFERSDVAEIERSAILNNDSISSSNIFTHSEELVLLLEGLGFKCVIKNTKETMYEEDGCPCCDGEPYDILTSILTVTVP